MSWLLLLLFVVVVVCSSQRKFTADIINAPDPVALLLLANINCKTFIHLSLSFFLLGKNSNEWRRLVCVPTYLPT
jgi:hypothetical protein